MGERWAHWSPNCQLLWQCFPPSPCPHPPAPSPHLSRPHSRRPFTHFYAGFRAPGRKRVWRRLVKAIAKPLQKSSGMAEHWWSPACSSACVFSWTENLFSPISTMGFKSGFPAVAPQKNNNIQQFFLSRFPFCSFFSKLEERCSRPAFRKSRCINNIADSVPKALPCCHATEPINSNGSPEIPSPGGAFPVSFH